MTLELHEKQLIRSILDLVTHNRDYAADFFQTANILDSREELRDNLLPVKEFVLEHYRDDDEVYQQALRSFVSKNIRNTEIRTIFNNSLSIETVED